MLSAVVDILRFASEVYADPEILEADHSDPTRFTPREKLMSVIPLAWIGMRYKNKDNRNKLKNLISRKENNEKYFMKLFNESCMESDNNEESDCLGRNCLVSHFFAAFLEKGKFVKFGIIKLGKRGSCIDKKRIHLFNIETLETDYDVPDPSFLLKPIKGNEFEFVVSCGGYRSSRLICFKLNVKDVEKSKVSIHMKENVEGMSSFIHYRNISYPINNHSNRYQSLLNLEEVTLKTYAFEDNCLKMVESVSLGRLKQTFSIEDDDERKSYPEDIAAGRSIYHVPFYNRLEKQVEDYIIINYSHYFHKICVKTSLLKVIDGKTTFIGISSLNSDETLPIENESIVGGHLIDMIRLTNTHVLLFFQPSTDRAENDPTIKEKYFKDDLTWMILDVVERRVERIEPLSNISKIPIDGDVQIECTGNKDERRFNFECCALRPFESNPDLFQIFLFNTAIKDYKGKIQHHGKINSYFIKVRSLSRKINFIQSLYDIDINCQ